MTGKIKRFPLQLAAVVDKTSRMAHSESVHFSLGIDPNSDKLAEPSRGLRSQLAIGFISFQRSAVADRSCRRSS